MSAFKADRAESRVRLKPDATNDVPVRGVRLQADRAGSGVRLKPDATNEVPLRGVRLKALVTDQQCMTAPKK